MDWLGYLLSFVLFAISGSYLLQLISCRLNYIKRINKLPGPKTYPIVGNLPDILVPTNSKYEIDLIFSLFLFYIQEDFLKYGLVKNYNKLQFI